MNIWELTFRFFSFVDPNVRYVVLGSMLLGGVAGGLGCFTFLQRKSLIGDALAHAALPGICLAFLLIGRKDFAILLLGAAISSWLGAQAVSLIPKYTKLKHDAALGIVLTFFFGLGIVLLTMIQKMEISGQTGLAGFLFGQAAALSRGDVTILLVAALVLGITLIAGFRYFKILTFDAAFAASLGMPVLFVQALLTTMYVIAVVIGLQTVGVILIAAMLITPAAAARQWTDRLPRMIWIAVSFGALSGLLGTYISFLAPRLPTGPWMVLVISTLFVISILFAPRRGILARLRLQFVNRQKITRDHILKVMFKATIESTGSVRALKFLELLKLWSFTKRELRAGLSSLRRAGFVEEQDYGYILTATGMVEGARVTRLHRLWEVYLTRHLDLPEDHVHRDAEEMEHIITPELERELEVVLEHPEHDPHDKKIPYLGAKPS